MVLPDLGGDFTWMLITLKDKDKNKEQNKGEGVAQKEILPMGTMVLQKAKAGGALTASNTK